MSKEKILFTSESVGSGHPDKLCDQIADAILDATLALDENAHVAIEVMALADTVIIGGEVKAKKRPDFEAIARSVMRKVGYTSSAIGIDADKCRVISKVNEQSENIAQSVNKEDGDIAIQGAGDQGMMFGYATDETENYMPLAISIAHKLVRVADNKRHEGVFIDARPDMKSQVTIDYSDPNNIRVDTVVMSVQHEPTYNKEAFTKYISEEIILPVIKGFGLNTDYVEKINSSGVFYIGGPLGDTGVTGRKIIVDTYGGTARHGGGAFSGKDPSKVDRSGAYMARYIAKNLVAAGVAKRLEVQLSYAIGEAEPVSIGISTFGTANYSDDVILKIIRQVFECRPGLIIENFSLKKPTFKYKDVTNYGHFGRPDLDLPWEKLDKVNEIKSLLK